MKTNGDLLTKKFNPRPKRIFSLELKKKLVSEIEYNRLTINDVVNMYQVANQTVYRWLREYSSTYKNGLIEKRSLSKRRHTFEYMIIER